MLTDKCLKDNHWIIEKVQEENAKQLKKWGIQMHSPFEWIAFAAEELGETAKAISEYEYRDGPKAHVVDEAIQCATLLLKIAEMYDDSTWPDPMGDEGAW